MQNEENKTGCIKELRENHALKIKRRVCLVQLLSA